MTVESTKVARRELAFVNGHIGAVLKELASALDAGFPSRSNVLMGDPALAVLSETLRSNECTKAVSKLALGRLDAAAVAEAQRLEREADGLRRAAAADYEEGAAA